MRSIALLKNLRLQATSSPCSAMRHGGNLQFGATAHKEGITLSVHSDYRLPEITQQLKTAWSETLPDGFEARLRALSQYRKATTRGYR